MQLICETLLPPRMPVTIIPLAVIHCSPQLSLPQLFSFQFILLHVRHVTSCLVWQCEAVNLTYYLTLLLRSSSFYDQYGYKPTGSTTCALADLTYRIHNLLESNQYVRCVLIDFSKAFDTVDHVILARKLFCLETPVFIIQWIMKFVIPYW